MTIKLRVSIVAATAVGAFLLASCSPGDLLESAVEKGVEKGVEAATGADIDIDEDGGNMSIKTEDGEMSFGTGAELPETFPESEVPLVDGEIMTSMRIKDETSDGYSVSIVVEGTIADVNAEAVELLEGAGFESTSESDMGEMRTAGFEGSGDVAGVLVTSMADLEEGTVIVGYIVTMRGDE